MKISSCKLKSLAPALPDLELTLKTRERKEGMKKRTQVAGGKVTRGEVAMNALVRVTRGGADGVVGEVIHEGKVISLRHFKEEARLTTDCWLLTTC